MATNALLKAELRETLGQIKAQIQAMEELVAHRPMQDLYKMKFGDGKFVMTDLLVAKAMALNGLAVLSSNKS